MQAALQHNIRPPAIPVDADMGPFCQLGVNDWCPGTSLLLPSLQAQTWGLFRYTMAFLSSAATLRSIAGTSATHPASAQPAGADVGGFFGNVDTELLVRWNQVATFYPFFRGHAHLEAKRREPWLFGEDATRQNRAAIRARYALLPYLYTLFWEAHTSGGSMQLARVSEGQLCLTAANSGLCSQGHCMCRAR